MRKRGGATEVSDYCRIPLPFSTTFSLFPFGRFAKWPARVWVSVAYRPSRLGPTDRFRTKVARGNGSVDASQILNEENVRIPGKVGKVCATGCGVTFMSPVNALRRKKVLERKLGRGGGRGSNSVIISDRVEDVGQL